MNSEFWINLPVRDVAAATGFFRKLGFAFNEERTNDAMACMLMGDKNVVVMLFPEDQFSGFSGSGVADTSRGAEVLFSIDAQSPHEVDAFIEKVRAAGGKVFAEPAEADGWMYAAGFADPDGHRWSVLYMDETKMPGAAT